MRAREFLFEGYKDAVAKFVHNGADDAEAKAVVQKFKNLVSKNQIKSINEKNIDWWATKPLEDLVKFINKFEADTKTQQKRNKISGQSINLIDNDEWLIVVPLDKDASCFHGKNTDWCTTKRSQHHFERYFYKDGVTLIYCIQKSTGKKWAIACGRKFATDYFDQKDTSISANTFKEETGWDPKQLEKLALYYNEENIDAIRNDFRNNRHALEQAIYALETRDPAIEKQIMEKGHDDLAVAYLEHVIENDLKPQGLPEKILIMAMQKRPFDFTYIAEFASEKVKEVAVTALPACIELIKNPSEKLQLLATKDRYDTLGLIDNPTMPVVERAMRMSNGNAIRYIKDPSPEVQLAAMNVNRNIFPSIKNPSDEVMKMWANYIGSDYAS